MLFQVFSSTSRREYLISAARTEREREERTWQCKKRHPVTKMCISRKDEAQGNNSFAR
jgi:hypothetical protein